MRAARPRVPVWGERALAAVWRSATTRHQRMEACLEAAPAAALEEPEVLRRLAERLRWTLPEGSPEISTQDVVGDGRTDITLTWPEGWGAPGQATGYLDSHHARVAHVLSLCLPS